MPTARKYKKLTIYPTEKVYIEFGKRVRFLREIHGITQVVLSRKLGLSRTSLTNVEAGRQRLLLHSVRDYAKALRIKPEHLLKGIW